MLLFVTSPLIRLFSVPNYTIVLKFPFHSPLVGKSREHSGHNIHHAKLFVIFGEHATNRGLYK